MANILKFIGPTRYRFVFVAEWFLFSFLILLQGGAGTSLIANLLWPLALYYLSGCVFVSMQGKLGREIARCWVLCLVSLGAVVLDQGIKVCVSVWVQQGELIAVIPGRLGVGHVQNSGGSWVLANLGHGVEAKAFLLLLILPLVLLAPLVYRFHVRRFDRGYWPAIALVGLWAGAVGWTFEIVVRGGIIDYIGIPGVAVADLKDILLSFGVAAFLVEVWDNPKISLGWKGWRGSWAELRELGSAFAVFTAGEFRALRGREFK